MQAKVKQSWRWNVVKAFTGREYVKYEWRTVPDGNEAEAHRLEEDGLLEYRQGPPPAMEPPDATDAAIALALESGIDLSSVSGSGTDGRILVGDIRALLDEEE